MIRYLFLTFEKELNYGHSCTEKNLTYYRIDENFQSCPIEGASKSQPFSITLGGFLFFLILFKESRIFQNKYAIV